MIRHVSRLALPMAAVCMAVALVVGAPTGALARTAPSTKIRPHQHFAGEVNGLFDNAIVKVVCPLSGKHGRALSGQTLSVTSPLVIAKNFGYTGSRGKAIVANVGPAAAAAETIRFARYDHPQPFPTNIPVPCGGTGVVKFFPVPGGHGGYPATVTVTYANVAVTGTVKGRAASRDS